MARPVSIAIIASLVFAFTARADEPDVTKNPAVIKALDKARKDVKKAFAEAKKALNAEADRLSKQGKPKEAVAVQDLAEELETELMAGEASPETKEKNEKKPRGNGGRKPLNPAMAGADPWNGHHYKVIHEPLSWKQAEKWCQDKGGHLVIIEDEKEQDALVRWLAQPGVPNRLYIGATKDNNAGEWLWVDGSPMTFKNWMRNQPVDPCHYSIMNLDAVGQWESYRLDNKFPFICEWDF